MIAVQGPTVAATPCRASPTATWASSATSGSGPSPRRSAAHRRTVLRTGFSGEKGYELVTAPEDVAGASGTR